MRGNALACIVEVADLRHRRFAFIGGADGSVCLARLQANPTQAAARAQMSSVAEPGSGVEL
jgi:hypothetical protein